jgi:hypothetical protein
MIDAGALAQAAVRLAQLPFWLLELAVQALQLNPPTKSYPPLKPSEAPAPVLIHPPWIGAPEPLSARVYPRAVSYLKFEGSWISQIDAMWYPATHAAVA